MCSSDLGIAHRGPKCNAVVERADNRLDAALTQAPDRRLVWPAYQRPHPGPTCQQRAGNRSTLPARGAQNQNR